MALKVKAVEKLLKFGKVIRGAFSCKGPQMGVAGNFSSFYLLISLIMCTFAPNSKDMGTLSNVEIHRSEAHSQGVRLTPDAIPDAVSTQTGVSVRYAQSPEKKWFVFRVSYGREDKASDILIEDGTYTYVAKRITNKMVDGKRRKILESLIPNLLFAYTTEEKAEIYVRKTPALDYLTYYYNHFAFNEEMKNPPLTVSCAEMENFIYATKNRNEHVMMVESAQCHYKGGDLVRVVEGSFKNVVGRVARVVGQQRVILSLSDIGLIATAYIPSAFIEKI